MVGGTDRPRVSERIDSSCDLLSHAYRRRILYALRQDGPATASELADAVLTAGLADAHDRALAALVHTHLPKLDEYGAVEYDRDDGVVSVADGISRLEPLLSVTARQETEPARRSLDEGSRSGVSR